MRGLFKLCLPLILLMLLPGCTQPPKAGNITDGLGRTLTIDSPPQRIISLAPSNTEIIYAMGLSDRLVGVTEFCNYPPEAQTKPKIGGFSNVNIESVVALNPDLVLGTHMHAKTVIPALEKLNINVMAIAPRSIEEMLQNIDQLGSIADLEKQSAKLVNDLQKRIDNVTGKISGLKPEQRPRVLYLTWHDPMYTAGQDTLPDEVIRLAGGTNIASDLVGDKTIDLESVIQRNPQVIITSLGHGSGGEETYRFILNEPRLKNTDALKSSRVYKIDGDLIQRAGPRIVDALEIVAGFVHPEIFGK